MHIRICLQVVPLLCSYPSWATPRIVSCRDLSSSLATHKCSPLPFSLAFLTFTNSSSATESHGQVIYDQYDDSE